MKLLTGTHDALRANHPFKLHGHQLGSFADHGLEAGVVIGQTFDLAVLCLVLSGQIVEPQRSAHQFVPKAQGIEHFGAGLAYGYRTFGGVLKRQRAGAVVEGQGVLGLGRLGQYRQGQTGHKGNNTV